jgi:hypothetical protein
LVEQESRPYAIDFFVGGSGVNFGVPFIVRVFDANDWISQQYSFYNYSGVPSDQAGIVFSQTEFDQAEIRQADCTGSPLVVGTLYGTTAFCYYSYDVHGIEYSTYAAVDQYGQESRFTIKGIFRCFTNKYRNIGNVSLITFDATDCLIGCTADDSTGLNYSSCTSVGRESNAFRGITPIPIYLFPFDFGTSYPIFTYRHVHMFFIFPSLTNNCYHVGSKTSPPMGPFIGVGTLHVRLWADNFQ